MSKARKGAKVWLVERVAFRAWDFRGLHFSRCSTDQGDSLTPVRAFTDRAAAEACRDALEAEERAAFSPALFAADSLPNGLAERIRSLGFEPPKLGKEGYNQADEFRKWWAAHAAEIAPEQQAALWELFGDVKLYQVSSQSVE
jgi:hypothetical protein